MKTTAAAISVLVIVVASALAGYIGYQDLNGSTAVRSIQPTTISEITTVAQTANDSTVTLPGQTIIIPTTVTVALETVTVTQTETTTDTVESNSSMTHTTSTTSSTADTKSPVEFSVSCSNCEPFEHLNGSVFLNVTESSASNTTYVVETFNGSYSFQLAPGIISLFWFICVPNQNATVSLTIGGQSQHVNLNPTSFFFPTNGSTLVQGYGNTGNWP